MNRKSRKLVAAIVLTVFMLNLGISQAWVPVPPPEPDPDPEPAPIFKSKPSSTSVVAGNSKSFTWTAYSYTSVWSRRAKFYVNGVLKKTKYYWSNYADLTYSYTPSSGGSYSIKCVISDNYGSSTHTVTLTATTPEPVFTSYPSGMTPYDAPTIYKDDQITLTWTAQSWASVGSRTAKIYKYGSSTPLKTYNDWNNGDYLRATIDPNEEGMLTYTCEISDAFGTASWSAFVNVIGPDPEFTVSPAATTIIAYHELTLTWEAFSEAQQNTREAYIYLEGNSDPLESFTDWGNYNPLSITINPQTGGTRTYRCVISDYFGTSEDTVDIEVSTPSPGFMKTPSLTETMVQYKTKYFRWQPMMSFAPEDSRSAEIHIDGELYESYGEWDDTTIFGLSYQPTTAGEHTVSCIISDAFGYAESTVSITVISDMDGDGDPDSTDPDIDGDGLSNDEEINNYGTNPEKIDSDDDELTDYEEIYRYGTDPSVSENFEIINDKRMIEGSSDLYYYPEQIRSECFYVSFDIMISQTDNADLRYYMGSQRTGGFSMAIWGSSNRINIFGDDSEYLMFFEDEYGFIELNPNEIYTFELYHYKHETFIFINGKATKGSISGSGIDCNLWDVTFDKVDIIEHIHFYVSNDFWENNFDFWIDNLMAIPCEIALDQAESILFPDIATCYSAPEDYAFGEYTAYGFESRTLITHGAEVNTELFFVEGSTNLQKGYAIGFDEIKFQPGEDNVYYVRTLPATLKIQHLQIIGIAEYKPKFLDVTCIEIDDANIENIGFGLMGKTALWNMVSPWLDFDSFNEWITPKFDQASLLLTSPTQGGMDRELPYYCEEVAILDQSASLFIDLGASLGLNYPVSVGIGYNYHREITDKFTVYFGGESIDGELFKIEYWASQENGFISYFAEKIPV